MNYEKRRIVENKNDDPDYIDSIIPPHEDFIYGIDIERFIYQLTSEQSIVLLFLSLGYKPKEIRSILGFKNVNSIGKIVMGLKDVFRKEYF